MATLQDIRAKLAAAQQKKEKSNFSDNAVYQFWNIPEGATAGIRFLPDGDPSSDFFWQERQVIRLPFVGIKGQDETKQVSVTVPCLRMWGEVDPILNETKPWWKDPELEELARTYWIKKSYVFQGFVNNNPYKEDVENLPENPIRRFIINSSIFKIIEQSLMDAEMQYIPTDYEHGRDFKIIKNKKGQYADYSTSSWSFNARALSVTELEAIEKFGLYKLSDFLPTKPTDEQKAAIVEMFHASVNGEPYDEKKFGEYYKPSGMGKSDSSDTGGEVLGGGSKTTVAVSAPVVAAPVVDTVEQVVDTTPVAEAAPVAATSPLDAIAKLKAKAAEAAAPAATPASDTPRADAQAILDLIKNRTASN